MCLEKEEDTFIFWKRGNFKIKFTHTLEWLLGKWILWKLLFVKEIIIWYNFCFIKLCLFCSVESDGDIHIFDVIFLSVHAKGNLPCWNLKITSYSNQCTFCSKSNTRNIFFHHFIWVAIIKEGKTTLVRKNNFWRRNKDPDAVNFSNQSINLLLLFTENFGCERTNTFVMRELPSLEAKMGSELTHLRNCCLFRCFWWVFDIYGAKH